MRYPQKDYVQRNIDTITKYVDNQVKIEDSEVMKKQRLIMIMTVCFFLLSFVDASMGINEGTLYTSSKG